MALFKRAPGVEEELDKARVCGRWDQVLSLEQRYKSKSIPSGLRHVLKGEVILEQWLPSQAGSLPTEALEKLRSVQNEDEVVSREALIILGKCHWYRNNYREAHTVLDRIKITSLDNLSLHHQKLLVDYYAFYGLCQEYAGQLDDALNNYDKCLQMLIKLAIQLETCLFRSEIALPHSIHAAIVKATVLCLNERKYKNALYYCRKILLAHDYAWLSGLQQICSLLLAELLILYFPAAHHTPITSTAVNQTQSVDTPIGEAILTLSLAKTGAVTSNRHDVVLDHLMTLILIEANLPSTLAEVLEETVKSSHHNGADVSQQFGLVLCAAGKEKQAMMVMEENVQLCAHDPITILMVCKTALQQRKLNDALKFAIQAVAVTKAHWLLPRAHQMLGVCYAALAQQEISRSRQKEYHQLAVKNMQEACIHDNNNVEMSFELALQLSEGREISAAITEVKRALQLDNCHVNSLHLLVLLYSAEKKYKEAHDLCKFTLELSPTNLSLWLCIVQLELLLFGAQQALQTCKLILKVWQDKYGGLDERTTGGLLNVATKDQASLTDLPFGEVHPTGVTFNEMISDTDSTMYTISTNPGDILLAKIWCLIAELFQVEGMYTDSLLACVKEAFLLAPSSPHVLTQLGRILEGSRRYAEAGAYYSHAIARDPSFAPAMAHRGHLLAVEGELEQAEQCLKESVERSPLDHNAWRWLGEVFEKKGETTLALDCYMTAMNFEASAAILPFASVTNESKL